MDAPSRLRSIRTVALTVLLALSGLVAAGPPPAAAQGFGWFGGLFGGGQPRQPQRPAYPGYGYNYDYGSQGDAAPRRRVPRRHPVDQAVKETPKEKAPAKNAALFVDVFGDSLGQMLANGLDDALSDRPDVAVVHKARGSTGLVASDFYDWPKAIQDTLAARKDAGADTKKTDKPEKIDVAVMMIGSNDRQPIRVDGKTLATGTPEWTEAYKKRVAAIDEAFRAKGIPLVWVGIPITKDDNFADDMAALNDIYREAATKYGATYVDTWEAFSDDDGEFNAFGPDVNGQTVRLRAADGVHFTKAGARKLAHFVETHVRRDLDGKGPIPQLPTDTPMGEANANSPTKAKGAVAAIKPEAGPIKNLNDPPSATNGQLSVATGSRATGEPDDIVRRSLQKGEAQTAPSGRADDLRWPSSAANPN
jgi:hypothetical protein